MLTTTDIVGYDGVKSVATLTMKYFADTRLAGHCESLSHNRVGIGSCYVWDTWVQSTAFFHWEIIFHVIAIPAMNLMWFTVLSMMIWLIGNKVNYQKGASALAEQKIFQILGFAYHTSQKFSISNKKLLGLLFWDTYFGTRTGSRYVDRIKYL